MYFCPCPCSEPLDPEVEEAARVTLPRNLSYVEESYLDRYSVSANFVHNPKIENSLRREQELADESAVVRGGTACGGSASVGGESGGEGEFRQPSSSTSLFTSPNVEDEERIALLSFLKAKELPTDCRYNGSAQRKHCQLNLEPVISSTTKPIGATKYKSNSVDIKNFGVPGLRSATDNSVSFSYSKWTASSIGFLEGCDSSSGFYLEQIQSPSSPETPTSERFVSQGNVITTSPTHTSTISPPLSSAPSTTSTSTGSSPVSVLLSPASRLTSRLSALLQSPPNESMDELARNGTCVDGDAVSVALGESKECAEDMASKGQSEVLQAPGDSGLELDRGLDNGDLKSSIFHDNVESCQSRSDPRDIDSNQHGVHDPNTSIPVEDIHLNAGDMKYFPTFYGSPDSDAFVEEGVFLNITDDVLAVDTTLTNDNDEGLYSHSQTANEGSENDIENDDNDRSLSTSEQSDETCVSADSMFMSPEEGDLDVDDDVEPEAAEGDGPRKMSIQEAINRAATDLNQISLNMYGPGALSKLGGSEAVASKFVSTGDLDVDDNVEPEAAEGDGPRKMSIQEAINRAATDLNQISLNMHGPGALSKLGGSEAVASKFDSTGRSSPVRTCAGLKLTISDHTSSERLNKSDLDLRDSANEGPESPVYADSEFNFNRKELRKSSSLKSNKTPPGTPHRKKAVRFADAMGLDLESVRHVLNTNSPPKIPASAMADLQPGLSEDRQDMGARYLTACFTQPGAKEDFYHTVISQKVCLENAIITDLTITGIVRVANLSFHKSVRVRYTHNSWSTFHDIAASYVQHSCDGPTDRFSFSLVAPAYFMPANRLEFAISFCADGVEYWDNNGGANYAFECFAKTVPTESESAWIHFL